MKTEAIRIRKNTVTLLRKIAKQRHRKLVDQIDVILARGLVDICPECGRELINGYCPYCHNPNN